MDYLLQADIRHYHYRFAAVGLQDFALNLTAGQCVVVRGQNGCGKTTALRCLCGLIPHLYAGDYDGDVRVKDIWVGREPLWKTTALVGALLQNPLASFITRSVHDEIHLGMQFAHMLHHERDRRFREMVAFLDLGDYVNRNPRTLSAGEQQRVLLATVLACKPQVLLLDEPTMRLDDDNRKLLFESLEVQRREGTGIVIFDHDEKYDRLDDVLQMKIGATVGTISSPDFSMPGLGTPAGSGLQVRGVSVRHESKGILKDVSMECRAGEIIAIMGPNGSGKTTLLRALAGLVRFEGSMTVDGKAKPDVAMVFENPDYQLYCPTVKEELHHVRAPLSDAAYRAVVDMFGLQSYEHTPPLLLSEGEKKRLSIALAIATRPGHGFLFDEPTLGLGAEYKQFCGKMVRALAAQGFFCIIATHDRAWAGTYADRILHVDRGEIISWECGSCAEVCCASAQN